MSTSSKTQHVKDNLNIWQGGREERLKEGRRDGVKEREGKTDKGRERKARRQKIPRKANNRITF